MGRLGQVSSFMIIGLTIVIMLGLLTFWMSANQEKLLNDNGVLTFNQKIQVIKSSVEQCMQESGEKGLYLIAAQGGAIFPEEGSYVGFQQYKVFFWMEGEKDLSPSIEKIESELEEYVKEKTLDCLPDFDEGEVHVDYSNAEMAVQIDEENVKLFFKLPIRLSVGGSSGELSAFYTQLDYDFSKIFKLAKDLVGKMIGIGDGLYYITPDCRNLSVNGMTNIFSINQVDGEKKYFKIITFNDYKPYYSSKQKVLALNIALHENKLLGYCNGV